MGTVMHAPVLYVGRRVKVVDGPQVCDIICRCLLLMCCYATPCTAAAARDCIVVATQEGGVNRPGLRQQGEPQ
eukprot:22809-Eustigmatos_ZCMA.PRE.1